MTGQPYLIRLPYTTPPLSLNSREHWAATAKKKAALRTEVKLLARGLPRYQRIEVTLVWQPKDRRRRDTDNPFPTIKSAVDGLVDAGVVEDDDSTRVKHGGVRLLPPDPGQKHGRLWLEVREVAQTNQNDYPM